MEREEERDLETYISLFREEFQKSQDETIRILSLPCSDVTHPLIRTTRGCDGRGSERKTTLEVGVGHYVQKTCAFVSG